MHDALGVAVRALVLVRALSHAPARLVLRAVGGAAVFWAGELLCAWAALRAFGVTVAVAPLVLGYITGYVSLGLPLPAGGAGSVDAAMTAGFVLAGAPLGGALLGAIAFRLFSFWLPAFGALLSLATLRGAARAPSRGGRGPSPAPDGAELTAQPDRAQRPEHERHPDRDRAVDEDRSRPRG